MTLPTKSAFVPSLAMASAALVSIAMISIAMASTAKASTWQTACDDALCVFRQQVPAPGGQGTSALFEILVDANAAKATIVLTTPLGVALEPGVRLEADGQTWAAPIKVCHADGCRATASIDEDGFAHLLQQQAITIHYHAFGAPEEVALELPLRGLVKEITSQR